MARPNFGNWQLHLEARRNELIEVTSLTQNQDGDKSKGDA
ncbi:hypothetical protein COLO4_05898 [Corchorus olitorius]|uniref:Uncharacterized protein n=1 Tax=Corchorus olitorius TaxID=93759 RepID=A0A1R3KPK3_9ROSI|nr:hypothetical protein COLO4_05898 [Corchorus olitorius]